MRETRTADRGASSLTTRRDADMRTTRLPAAVTAAITAVALGTGSPAQAQQTDAPEGAAKPDGETPRSFERCATPEHRQFDFWLGRWEVRDPDGEVVGHNEIRRVAGGCGLLEIWRGVEGGAGTSINAYEADLGRWTQRWVGTGSSLWLDGGIEKRPDGRSMVLAGTALRSTPRGPVLDRLSWTPLPDGRVRQVWETSPDGGETWEEIFVGLYVRMPREEKAEEPRQ